jgi:hypothetical protein
MHGPRLSCNCVCHEPPREHAECPYKAGSGINNKIHEGSPNKADECPGCREMARLTARTREGVEGPRHEIISEPGAAIEVTRVNLTDEERDELSISVRLSDLPTERDEIAELKAEIERLNGLINTPHTADFLSAVPLEAAHQIARWGTEHDGGKEPTDWLWLVGYLAGKATNAAISGNIEKAKHHTISTAAAMLNWHRRLSGEDQTFQPGTTIDRK